MNIILKNLTINDIFNENFYFTPLFIIIRPIDTYKLDELVIFS